MKPNSIVQKQVRRLSSDQAFENRFESILSPHANQHFFKPADLEKLNKNPSVSNLKPFLSPTNSQNHEFSKRIKSVKLEDERLKDPHKNSHNFYEFEVKQDKEKLNHNNMNHLNKRTSGEQYKCSHEKETLHKKAKPSISERISNIRLTSINNFDFKDEVFGFNPMRSPLSEPHKISPKHLNNKSESFTKGDEKVLNTLNDKGCHDRLENRESSSSRQEGGRLKNLPANLQLQFFDLKKSKFYHKSHIERLSEKNSAYDREIMQERHPEVVCGQRNEKRHQLMSPRRRNSNNNSPLVSLNNTKSPHRGSQKQLLAKESIHDPAQLNIVSEIKENLDSNQFLHLYHHKQNPIIKDSQKKEPKKSNRKEFNFFQKVKELEAIHNQIKNKSSESETKIDSAICQQRPRSSKNSDLNPYKEMQSPLSPVYGQMKRNSAAQIYNSINLFENYIQSTRSAVDQSEHHYFSKWTTNEEKSHFKNRIPELNEEFKKKNIEAKFNHVENEPRIDSYVQGIFKNNSLDQLKNNPHAKFLNLRKQVQEKRTNRDFKSVDQKVLTQFKSLELRGEQENNQKRVNLQKQATEDHLTMLPDTTDTTTKQGLQNQLVEIHSRVQKMLDFWNKQKKMWNEEKQILLKEIQELKEGKQGKA